VPEDIDTGFVKRFHDCVVARIRDGCSFVLVVGGGKTARRYIDAASLVHSIEDDDKDWLGIHATRMNAHFLRTIFREWAHPKINTNPHDLEDFYQVKEPIIVAGGWRPGFSTDYIAVVLAKYLGFTSILNLSDINGVYNRPLSKLPHLCYSVVINKTADLCTKKYQNSRMYKSVAKPA